jgi:hypothetical protein
MLRASGKYYLEAPNSSSSDEWDSVALENFSSPRF